MMQPQMEGVVLQDQIKELLQRASRDSLSGLLNRAIAEQLIRQRLKNSATDEQCALFIIDLDDFKSVNDTLGHQAGDFAIRETARILSSLFHANDIISRFGGDEFLIFTSGRLTIETIEDKGHEICKKLQISLSDSDHVVLSASAGICISGTSSDFEILYKCANLELYKAKNSGKGRYSIRVKEILIDVTNFFRDPGFFEKLKYNAIYKIVDRWPMTRQILVPCSPISFATVLTGMCVTSVRTTPYIMRVKPPPSQACGTPPGVPFHKKGLDKISVPAPRSISSDISPGLDGLVELSHHLIIDVPLEAVQVALQLGRR